MSPFQQDLDPLAVLRRVRERLGPEEDPDPLDVLARVRSRLAEEPAPFTDVPETLDAPFVGPLEPGRVDTSAARLDELSARTDSLLGASRALLAPPPPEPGIDRLSIEAEPGFDMPEPGTRTKKSLRRTLRHIQLGGDPDLTARERFDITVNDLDEVTRSINAKGHQGPLQRFQDLDHPKLRGIMLRLERQREALREEVEGPPTQEGPPEPTPTVQPIQAPPARTREPVGGGFMNFLQSDPLRTGLQRMIAGGAKERELGPPEPDTRTLGQRAMALPGVVGRGIHGGAEFIAESAGETFRQAARAITADKLAPLDLVNKKWRGQFAQWLDKLGSEIAGGAQERAAEIEPGKGFYEIQSIPDAIEWAASSIPQAMMSTIPPLVGGVAGGLATRNPAGAIIGAIIPSYAMSRTESRRTLLEEGVEEERAERIADFVAIPMALLEMAFPASLGRKMTQPIRKQINKGVARRFMGAAAVGTVTEGTTEAAQETTQLGAAIAATGRRVTMQDLARVFEAGVTGALAGKVFAVAGQTVTEGQMRNFRRAFDRFDEGMTFTLEEAEGQSRDQAELNGTWVRVERPDGTLAWANPETEAIRDGNDFFVRATDLHNAVRKKVEEVLAAAQAEPEAQRTDQAGIPFVPEPTAEAQTEPPLEAVRIQVNQEKGTPPEYRVKIRRLAEARDVLAGVEQAGEESQFDKAEVQAEYQAAVTDLMEAFERGEHNPTPEGRLVDSSARTERRVEAGEPPGGVERRQLVEKLEAVTKRHRVLTDPEREPTYPDTLPDEPVVDHPAQIAGRWEPPRTSSTGVYRERLDRLTYAPQLMQFKDLGPSGIDTRLDDVTEWDDRGESISVWLDPEDGKLYVVNGHHRYKLAERLGVEELNVSYIEADTIVEARASGALQNIRQNQGTPMDVAKFLRDSGATLEDLKAKGIPLKNPVMKKGQILAQLVPEVFNAVAAGTIEQTWGLAIGEIMPDNEVLQLAVVAAIRGKDMTGPKVREIARQMRAAGTEKVEQETLFGKEVIEESLYVEKANIATAVQRRMSEDKRIFGAVTKAGRAEKLRRAGETVIDEAAARDIAETSATAEEVFNRLYTRAGPVATIVTEAARRVKHGETIKAVVGDTYESIFDAVQEEAERATAGRGREERPESRGPTAEAAPEAETTEAVLVPTEAEREAGILAEQEAKEAATVLEAFPPKVTKAIDKATKEGRPATRFLSLDTNALDAMPLGTEITVDHLNSEPAFRGVWRKAESGMWQNFRDGKKARGVKSSESLASLQVSVLVDQSATEPVPVEPVPSMREAAQALEQEMGTPDAELDAIEEQALGGDAEGAQRRLNALELRAEEQTADPDQEGLFDATKGPVDMDELQARIDDVREVVDETYRQQQADLFGEPEKVELVGAEQTELLPPTAGVPKAKFGGKLTAEDMAERARQQEDSDEQEIQGERPLELFDLNAQGVQTAGPFASAPAVVTTTQTLNPISSVQLVRLAIQLLGGNKIFVKKYPQARGMFHEDPDDPRIGLHPDLGKDAEQFVKTLAHEIGHLVDFLPDADLRRGNILGRIASLMHYGRETVDALPTDPSRALTAKDRSQIRRRAEKEFGKRPQKDDAEGGDTALADWQAAVRERYAELIKEVVDERNLLERDVVKEELLLLSEWWRPHDSATATLHEKQYRESSRELYADAISVLLVSPGTLQDRAPVFFEAFMAYFERKAEVQAAYDGIQELVAAGPDEIYDLQEAELVADFARGEQIQRDSEEHKEAQSRFQYFLQTWADKGIPITAAEKKRLKAQKGKRVAAHDVKNSLSMAIEEFNHGDNANRLLAMNVAEVVHQPMIEADIDPDDAGMWLMLQRIAEGDRGGVQEDSRQVIIERTGIEAWEDARKAYLLLKEDELEFSADLLEQADQGYLNPKGYTVEEARKQFVGLKKKLGPEKVEILEDLMDKFRDIGFGVVEEAVHVESYNQEMFDNKLVPNRKTYASFAVLEYFTGRMPAGVKKQIGTVKGIANPYMATMLKMMSLTRLNERQKLALKLVDVLDVDFPGMASEERPIDKFHREQRAGPGRKNLTYLRDGKLYYREVDQYIAAVMEKGDLGTLGRAVEALGSKTYGIFHPLYVSWSIAWQLRNLPRDFFRTHKTALAAAHEGKPTYEQAVLAFVELGRLANYYRKNVGVAWRHAWSRPDQQIKEMLKDRALGRAFHSFDAYDTDNTLQRMLRQFGIMPPEEGWKGTFKQKARKAGRWIEVAGVFQETLAKAAVYHMLGDQGITGQKRAYIVRNYTGTPDSTKRGTGSDMANAIFMYSNVIMAGIRADMEVATQPTTASGYWLRSVLTNYMPKMMMAAGTAGFFGDDLEEWFSYIASYDLEKYIIIPVPPFYSKSKDGKKKAIYLRVPHDDTSRILAAVTWALVMGPRPNAAAHAVSTLAGEFPGISPTISIPMAGLQAIAGRNPWDAFRGRPMVPRTEWDAGGWARWKEMGRKTLGEFGVLSQLGGHWLYASPEEGETVPFEEAFRAVPGLSSIIKISDRGLNESRYWEIDWETQDRARLRLDLSQDVRNRTRKRNRLNRFGVERLSRREQIERDRLNRWYRRFYKPQTERMKEMKDRMKDAGKRGNRASVARSRRRYEKARDRLNASTSRR